jgi:hypothetical protein
MNNEIYDFLNNKIENLENENKQLKKQIEDINLYFLNKIQEIEINMNKINHSNNFVNEEIKQIKNKINTNNNIINTYNNNKYNNTIYNNTIYNNNNNSNYTSYYKTHSSNLNNSKTTNNFRTFKSNTFQEIKKNNLEEAVIKKMKSHKNKSIDLNLPPINEKINKSSSNGFPSYKFFIMSKQSI